MNPVRPGRAARGPRRLATCLVLAPLGLPLVSPHAAEPGAASRLDPVVVSATRSPQPRSSVLADLTVLERETLEQAGAIGLADLLARQPGVEFARNGGPGAVTSVFIRGGESRHTAVYLDGVRLDSQATGGVIWEQIPLEQLERVEILRGPAAAIYGSDAVAGVVQLFTRRGQGPAQPSLRVSAGSQRSRQVQASLRGAHGDLDYAFTLAQDRSDGQNARRGFNPDEDGHDRRSGSARLGWRLDGVHRLDATWLQSRLRSDYDGFLPGVDDENRHRLRSAGLAWEARWQPTATSRAQWGESDSVYESQPDGYRTETRLRNLLLQHEQQVGDQRLSVALERREDRLVNPATAFSPRLAGERHQDALALGWRLDRGAHALQAQLRHDDDSEFGGQDTGSLAWGWSFAPGWRAGASAATSFRAPTLFQRFSEFGRDDLTPERGRNVEASLRWAGEGREASLVAWRNRLRDLIGFGEAGACASAFGCFANVGRAELEGVTLAGRQALGPVELQASLDWLDARNEASGRRLARRAPRQAKVGAIARLQGWTLGAELLASAERFDDAANTRRLGGYTLLNLHARTTLARGLSLFARIDNVGDKDHELARTFPSLGRRAELGLRWTLE